MMVQRKHKMKYDRCQHTLLYSVPDFYLFPAKAQPPLGIWNTYYKVIKTRKLYTKLAKKNHQPHQNLNHLKTNKNGTFVFWLKGTHSKTTTKFVCLFVRLDPTQKKSGTSVLKKEKNVAGGTMHKRKKENPTSVSGGGCGFRLSLGIFCDMSHSHKSVFLSGSGRSNLGPYLSSNIHFHNSRRVDTGRGSLLPPWLLHKPPTPRPDFFWLLASVCNWKCLFFHRRWNNSLSLCL